jgi:hypothetical protein
VPPLLHQLHDHIGHVILLNECYDPILELLQEDRDWGQGWMASEAHDSNAVLVAWPAMLRIALRVVWTLCRVNTSDPRVDSDLHRKLSTALHSIFQLSTLSYVTQMFRLTLGMHGSAIVGNESLSLMSKVQSPSRQTPCTDARPARL